MKKARHIAVLALIVFVVFPLACSHARAHPSFQNQLISFEHIPSPNFGVINCIIRDDRGFLWFGTARGFCKYDGYQVRVLTIGTDTPLHGNVLGHDRQVVNAMMRLDDGTLLLATDLGMWNFNPNTEQCTPFPVDPDLSENSITALVQDSVGTMWIGTTADGLFRFDRKSGTVQRYTTKNGLSDNHITCLLFDHAGELWIGTLFGGLNILDRSAQIKMRYRKSGSETEALSSDHIMSLCERDDKELWIGTEDGVNVLDCSTGLAHRLDLHSSIKHSIWSIASDPLGRMWIAASELGLFSYSNGVLTQFTPTLSGSDAERSLISVRVLYPDPVATDRTSLLFWVGTRSGVDKVLISRNPFNNYIRNQDSLQLNRGAVLSMCEDHNGILWVGLWGGGLNGLRRINGTYRCVANLVNSPSSTISLPNNDVNSVIEDHNQNIWIGTSNGLAMLDTTRKHIVVDKHIDGDSTSIVSNVVDKIYEDHEDNIWICTEKGLSNLAKVPNLRKGDAHRFKNYLHLPTDARPFGGNVVSDILEDHAGNLWVATYGRGLNKLNANNTFTRFLHAADSAANKENFIYTLFENREGLFWLSTRNGLVLFDPHTGTFSRYPIYELNNAHIFDILPDDNGDLWLSTTIGLAKFNPETKAFARITSEHGLQFNEFFSGFFRSKQGTLFVGGTDGFTEFSLKDLSSSTRSPEIAITSFKVLDKEFSTTVSSVRKIGLPYDQNFLSFSFAVLDYANPLQNRFKYRMVGVDVAWVDAGSRNYATYPKLDPGNYVFEVKGCNSNNVWNESGTSISIIITPPYWQTLWFRLFIVGLISGAVYAAYRYRLRKLLEMERLRLRIADDLHDDVGSNLSTIAMVSRVVQRAPELTTATKDKLAEIYDTAITTAEGMKDIVWFIKPKGDVLDDLLLRMKETASSLLGDIEYTFHTPANEGSSRVSIDFKRNFFLAFKEVLTNIAKHASATEVHIHVSRWDSMLEIVIRDNGRGFDELTIRHGNGLGSLRNRALNLHGECQIISLPGKGTTIRFSGKL